MKNQTFIRKVSTVLPHPRYQLLSVIIPAYNAASTLEQQLEALKAQTYEGKWEIVVVDNCSTDKTVELVHEYQRQLPHLRLVHAPKKRNRSYARNIGAQAARGEVLLFCDADDVIAADWITALANALEVHDFVCGVVEAQTLNPCPPQTQYSEKGANYSYLNFLPIALGGNFAISREAFEAVDGFSEEFPRCQDVELSWRLQLQGYPIHHEPTAIIHGRYRGEIWPIWQRSVMAGEADVKLYRLYAAHGMPQSSVREALQTYKSLIKKAPRLLFMPHCKRINWMRRAGRSWGRLWGSLRYRALYL
ncbi:MAG TPA: glycosyltransferase [Anaerolineae bacterium]|nr:glycosyltransferase [Anaerolineae bacterium]